MNGQALPKKKTKEEEEEDETIRELVSTLAIMSKKYIRKCKSIWELYAYAFCNQSFDIEIEEHFNFF